MSYNYTEWDFSELSFGNTYIKVYYDGVSIKQIDVPCFNLKSENYSDSMMDNHEDINVKGVNFTVNISASDKGIYISIDCSEDDSNIKYDLFDVSVFEYGKYGEDFYVDKEIALYVPTVSYTNTSSSVMYDINANIGENKKILPLFYIEDTNRFTKYINDELINYQHFVDLFDIEIIVNQDEREQQKLDNKNRRTNRLRALPLKDLIKEPLNGDEILDLYNNIENKNNIIPVYQIKNDNLDIQAIKKDVLLLKDNYEVIAIRVINTIFFIIHHKEIMEMLSTNFNKFYLILDMGNNFDVSTIKSLINTINDSKNIIYLGSNFTSTDLTISRNHGNENHFKENKILDIYFELLQDIPALYYGDYCGFDKKTITKFRGIATARVVLLSLNTDNNTVLIRRGWDDKDKTSNPKVTGYKFSMRRLLRDISENEIDKDFLNEELCDSDEGLKSFGETTTTPGKIKTLCLRHNVLSIINRYMID